jgi:hypothetical protein
MGKRSQGRPGNCHFLATIHRQFDRAAPALFQLRGF